MRIPKAGIPPVWERWNLQCCALVRMSCVMMTISRMGLAINEAVEIAKKYGQESSGGFVNAILAKIMKSGE